MLAKTLAALIVTTSIAGCVNTPSGSGAAICAGTAESRVKVADTLLDSDDMAAKVAGLELLDKLKAGCNAI